MGKQKYITKIRPALRRLQEHGLITGFTQRPDLYWEVDNGNGEKAIMTDEMAIGFIEGVLSQNQEKVKEMIT